MTNKTIKLLSINLILFLSIFMLFGYTPKNTPNVSEYNGVIEHLTFNTLISFPDKALDSNNTNSTLIDETKITPTEFNKILQELYSNNYILISMKDLFFIENNIIYSQPLFIPKNKKPIILSFNNVAYKSSFQNSGEIDKIIIDNEGKFATYSTKQSIQNRIAHDNEFIPILEDFIDTNPDFSYNNAKGIIFLTIDNGILGYHIDPKNASSKHDIKRISEITRRLISNGWEFGSNNYSYTIDSALNDMEFTKNITLWNKYTRPIIGTTNYYSSPFGKEVDEDSKLEILNNNNFRVIFYDNFTPQIEIKNQSIFMSRKMVSGTTLRNNKEDFAELFDCKKVYDFNERIVPFNKQ